MENPVKILHLEEDDACAKLVKDILKKGLPTCEYIRVKDRFEFEKKLQTYSPEVILTNHKFKSLFKHKKLYFPKFSAYPFALIYIADEYSEKVSSEILKSEAIDFFFKDRLERLPLAVSNASDRIRIEKRLEEQQEEVIGSERKFQTLIENISDAILLLDVKGTVLYQSLSAERISGFPSAQVLGRSIFELLHPADLQIATRFLKQAILKPALSIPTSYRIQQKKGGFIWVEGTITNFLHDENIKSLIIDYRNITERKISEERLQKSEANLRTIFDNTNVSYVLADKNFRILSFNSSSVYTYSKEFGVNIKEGESLLGYLPEDRRKATEERFRKALRGEKVSYEMSFLQPSGNTTWYNVNMFAVRDEIYNLLGFIISSENITERKNIELERNKMLSDIVQHNKDLEQFAYIISHNLRSPVANILGLSALMENSPDMDKASFDKCMTGLTLSVKKLDEVIVDLNYILQTRREINEKKEQVRFSELINDIKTSISNLIEKEHITINTNFTINKFFTIKSYLHSIFFNLIYNSIKYRNPAVSTVIEVQSKRINDKLVLEFRDNGLGIDLNAHRGNIFGLYKKFHKHIEGKGMGLYMVKTQVEILGGKISVASEVNKGTTFVIEFQE